MVISDYGLKLSDLWKSRDPWSFIYDIKNLTEEEEDRVFFAKRILEKNNIPWTLSLAKKLVSNPDLVQLQFGDRTVGHLGESMVKTGEIFGKPCKDFIYDFMSYTEGHPVDLDHAEYFKENYDLYKELGQSFIDEMSAHGIVDVVCMTIKKCRAYQSADSFAFIPWPL